MRTPLLAFALAALALPCAAGAQEGQMDHAACPAEAAPLVYGKYAEVKGEGWQRYFAEQAVLLWMRTGRDATLLDVLQLDVFGDKLKQAFYDLAEDVNKKRAALEALKE